MIKYFCDVCGKETLKQKSLARILVNVLMVLSNSDLDNYFDEAICFKCEKEIIKTVKNKIKELEGGKTL